MFLLCIPGNDDQSGDGNGAATIVLFNTAWQPWSTVVVSKSVVM